MKTLLVAIAKMENHYLRDWVEYYKKIGFDKIALCDNNEADGERFEEVIEDYIDSGFVEVEDFRGQKYAQYPAYEHCYEKYGKDYDWIAFFDIDEYFTICTPAWKVSDFLGQKIFENYDSIKFNWLCYGDNDLVEPDYSIPVYKRFLKPVEPVNFNLAFDGIPENFHVKAILRGGLQNVKFHSAHDPNFDGEEGRVCDAAGEVLSQNTQFKPMMYRGAYIRHYGTMTAREYVERWTRGDVVKDLTDKDKDAFVLKFFKYNKRTPEKEKIFEEAIGYDFTVKKRKDIQLFMLCYDKEEYPFTDNAVMTPLQCGAANGRNVCELKDNTGDNISWANFFYVETTGLYWIWNNIKDAKYKGQTQYRRRLKGVNEDLDYEGIFKDYDIICGKPYNYPENRDKFIPSNTVEGGYGYSHCIDDLKSLEEVIKSDFPDYSEDYDKYIKNGENLYYSNGFVLPTEKYDEYCNFLFEVLNRWLVKNGIQRYEDVIVHVARNLGAGKYIRYPIEGHDPMKLDWPSVQYQTRIGGYLSERIFTLYLYHNFPRRYEVDYEKMENGMYI